MTGAGAAPESKRDSAGFFSSAKTFFLPAGTQVDPEGVAGYPIDLRVKAPTPAWPPPWLPDRAHVLWVDVTQWGLACFERHLAGEEGAWLAGAEACGGYLLAEQGADGGWAHLTAYKHSWPLLAPWLSAMAQGQGASLLVRLFRATGDERWGRAARQALGPLSVPTAEGGVQAQLGGRPFPEEYPTTPPSFVLNGAIFALWGIRDVGTGLADAGALRQWHEGIDTLAANLDRWDTGWWSRYALYPHPVVNPASSFYHALHVAQLQATEALTPRPEIAAARRRFQGYAASRRCRIRAFAHKALFRVLVPRNRYLAFRLPWTRMRP
ncbi:MAG: heparosan-N-sulfate-glucuronate 5-epimerase, partial [Actinomycetota bacterium]|nr:heparosan-N-sulfate-glucuronate 5-epimerase [Actinomycetota bacterium]